MELGQCPALPQRSPSSTVEQVDFAGPSAWLPKHKSFETAQRPLVPIPSNIPELELADRGVLLGLGVPALVINRARRMSNVSHDCNDVSLFYSRTNARDPFVFPGYRSFRVPLGTLCVRSLFI